MEIEKLKVVSIDYVLTDDLGEEIDKSQPGDPLVYIQGTGSLIPGLEAELEGKVAGDELAVKVSPELGYGLIRDELFQEVDRSQFEGVTDLQVGMEFHAQTSNGMQVVTISKIEGDTVTINGNHPLAGQELNFFVKVIDVREATADELASGHIHSASCNHSH